MEPSSLRMCWNLEGTQLLVDVDGEVVETVSDIESGFEKAYPFAAYSINTCSKPPCMGDSPALNDKTVSTPVVTQVADSLSGPEGAENGGQQQQTGENPIEAARELPTGTTQQDESEQQEVTQIDANKADDTGEGDNNGMIATSSDPWCLLMASLGCALLVALQA